MSRPPLSRRRPLALVIVLLGVGLAAAAPAQIPPSLGQPTPAPRLGGAATVTAVIPPSVGETHRRRSVAPVARAGLVRAANAAARSFPSPDAYINATLYYDYEVGRLYQLQTSPHFLTAIMLRPGEKLVAKAAGDTVRWVLGETAQGAGANEQVVVLLKPIRGGLRTNVVLTTDQRTYMIEATSRDGGTYTPAVSWNYPQEQMQALAAERAVEAVKAQSEVAPGLAIDQLHFDYRIEAKGGKAPRWAPLRAFDDGTRTYIQFPVNMAATDAPPLFLVGPHDSAELVNYRYQGGYYIVDRLFDVAELRLGETPQAIVRITRDKARG